MPQRPIVQCSGDDSDVPRLLVETTWAIRRVPEVVSPQQATGSIAREPIGSMSSRNPSSPSLCFEKTRGALRGLSLSAPFRKSRFKLCLPSDRSGGATASLDMARHQRGTAVCDPAAWSLEKMHSHCRIACKRRVRLNGKRLALCDLYE